MTISTSRSVDPTAVDASSASHSSLSSPPFPSPPMKLESYISHQLLLPETGSHIIADHTDSTVVVYQAFKHAIADYAVANQEFGGPDYKHSRMSWIKPGFMWMMYRSGWATKKDQERILRITLKREGWESIVRAGTTTTFKEGSFSDEEAWKVALRNSEVRVQWDPDHGPDGEKLQRKAIQVGLKDKTLAAFNTDFIISIEDITPFVISQRNNRVADLKVPVERLVENE